MITKTSVQDLAARLQPHLDRMKLGSLFDGYSAQWSGDDASEMLDCIEEMCHILDVKVPQTLEHAWNLRRTQLGVPARPGLVLQSYAQNSVTYGTYLEMMSPTCELLRKSVPSGYHCGWNRIGCEAMHGLLCGMIGGIKVNLFRLLDEISNADLAHVDQVMQFGEGDVRSI